MIPKTHKEEPVVTVDRIEDSQYIVEDCELCGETHRHGAVEDYSEGDFYQRAAHCDDFGTYYLHLPE